ncbi:hypothetical protein AFK24_09275 [Pseudomonas syringae]|uniref:Uncharacterized protein n=1 Tax=Pseudomonas syringae TaxID=317 RepID=A0A1C7Z5D3_PSESX|nr:hypothetical protein AFK24_09275 [Pseudomonas syringae]
MNVSGQMLRVRPIIYRFWQRDLNSFILPIVAITHITSETNSHSAWVNPEASQIEQCVNVRPKKQSIVSAVCVDTPITNDVGGLKHIDRRASRDCAFLFVSD